MALSEEKVSLRGKKAGFFVIHTRFLNNLAQEKKWIVNSLLTTDTLLAYVIAKSKKKLNPLCWKEGVSKILNGKK